MDKLADLQQFLFPVCEEGPAFQPVDALLSPGCDSAHCSGTQKHRGPFVSKPASHWVILVFREPADS